MNNVDSLLKDAKRLGIKVIKAKTTKDQSIGKAIHLLNPDAWDLEDAINTACKDLYETIVIHNNKTWIKGV